MRSKMRRIICRCLTDRTVIPVVWGLVCETHDIRVLMKVVIKKPKPAIWIHKKSSQAVVQRHAVIPHLICHRLHDDHVGKDRRLEHIHLVQDHIRVHYHIMLLSRVGILRAMLI